MNIDNPKEEAILLVDTLFDELGSGGIAPYGAPYVDGKEAVLWMREEQLSSWREIEWAGYYLKHRMRYNATTYYPNHFNEITEGKCYLVKGKYLWDTRLRSIQATTKVILFDVEQLNSFVMEYGGLGLILANAIMSYDVSGEFKKWHEKLKGGPSNYTIQREAEGRPERIRKDAFMISHVSAYYFPKDIFLERPLPSWLKDDFQRTMRQQNGSERNAKYMIDLSKVPQDYLLVVRNFNYDPEDFFDDFGDYDLI